MVTRRIEVPDFWDAECALILSRALLRALLPSIHTNTIHYFDRGISEVLPGILIIFGNSLICDRRSPIEKDDQIRTTNLTEIVLQGRSEGSIPRECVRLDWVGRRRNGDRKIHQFQIQRRGVCCQQHSLRIDSHSLP